jgi:hypothetical protein
LAADLLQIAAYTEHEASAAPAGRQRIIVILFLLIAGTPTCRRADAHLSQIRLKL